MYEVLPIRSQFRDRTNMLISINTKIVVYVVSLTPTPR